MFKNVEDFLREFKKNARPGDPAAGPSTANYPTAQAAPPAPSAAVPTAAAYAGYSAAPYVQYGGQAEYGVQAAYGAQVSTNSSCGATFESGVNWLHSPRPACACLWRPGEGGSFACDTLFFAPCEPRLSRTGCCAHCALHGFSNDGRMLIARRVLPA